MRPTYHLTKFFVLLTIPCLFFVACNKEEGPAESEITNYLKKNTPRNVTVNLISFDSFIDNTTMTGRTSVRVEIKPTETLYLPISGSELIGISNSDYFLYFPEKSLNIYIEKNYKTEGTIKDFDLTCKKNSKEWSLTGIIPTETYQGLLKSEILAQDPRAEFFVAFKELDDVKNTLNTYVRNYYLDLFKELEGHKFGSLNKINGEQFDTVSINFGPPDIENREIEYTITRNYGLGNQLPPRIIRMMGPGRFEAQVDWSDALGVNYDFFEGSLDIENKLWKIPVLRGKIMQHLGSTIILDYSREEKFSEEKSEVIRTKNLIESLIIGQWQYKCSDNTSGNYTYTSDGRFVGEGLSGTWRCDFNRTIHLSFSDGTLMPCYVNSLSKEKFEMTVPMDSDYGRKKLLLRPRIYTGNRIGGIPDPTVHGAANDLGDQTNTQQATPLISKPSPPISQYLTLKYDNNKSIPTPGQLAAMEAAIALRNSEIGHQWEALARFYDTKVKYWGGEKTGPEIVTEKQAYQSRFRSYKEELVGNVRASTSNFNYRVEFTTRFDSETENIRRIGEVDHLLWFRQDEEGNCLVTHEEGKVRIISESD